MLYTRRLVKSWTSWKDITILKLIHPNLLFIFLKQFKSIHFRIFKQKLIKKRYVFIDILITIVFVIFALIILKKRDRGKRVVWRVCWRCLVRLILFIFQQHPHSYIIIQLMLYKEPFNWWPSFNDSGKCLQKPWPKTLRNFSSKF